MRSADEHLRTILDLVARTHPDRTCERIPREHAGGRVTAAPCRAATPSPPFDNSAMDGYAVRAADLLSASREEPVRLAVVGEAQAGHPAAGGVDPGTAMRIMTGAPIPVGADAVVPQELVVREEAGAVFGATTENGSHVRRAGEDVGVGDVVVDSGVTLHARHLAALASSGIAEVDVVKRPRVGILVTGDELVEPGTALGPGQIYDSNAVYLTTAVAAIGGVAVSLGRIGDDPDAVRAAVGAADVELIVTTGGASVGDHDPVKAGLASAGVTFVTVAMQPGKPQGAGIVAGIPVICLPGNPVAVAVSVEMFVGPVVRALLGVPEPPWEPQPAVADWLCPAGREQVIPVVFREAGVAPATGGGSGSHLVARLAMADALARVPADVQKVSAGDTVLVRRFTS